MESIELSPTDAVAINKKISDGTLILLGLELPLLIFTLFNYIISYGKPLDGPTLIGIANILIFLGTSVLIVFFWFIYIGDLIKYWKQLSNYNIVNVALYGLQLFLYLRLMIYL